MTRINCYTGTVEQPRRITYAVKDEKGYTIIHRYPTKDIFGGNYWLAAPLVGLGRFFETAHKVADLVEKYLDDEETTGAQWFNVASNLTRAFVEIIPLLGGIVLEIYDLYRETMMERVIKECAAGKPPLLSIIIDGTEVLTKGNRPGWTFRLTDIKKCFPEAQSSEELLEQVKKHFETHTECADNENLVAKYDETAKALMEKRSEEMASQGANQVVDGIKKIGHSFMSLFST